MTRSQAVFVKFLRVRMGCSWRSVAAHYFNRYNFDGTLKDLNSRIVFHGFTNCMAVGATQIDGVELCDQAADLLGESTLQWDEDMD